ncbi:hypothetical protein GF324_08835 [bacterium]|nr:hypothetical protein [bacterium]
MIAALILSILSLYPWNLNAGGYFTHGRDSEEKRIQLATATVGVDRLNRDAVTLAYERRHVEREGDMKLEHDYYAVRGYSWWDDRFRTGITGGYLDMELETWYVACVAEGELPEFGYGAHAIFARGGTDVAGTPDLYKLSLQLSRSFGPHLTWIGCRVEWEESKNRGMASFGVISEISRTVTVRFSHWFGESRFFIDPHAMTMDNTPSLITRKTTAQADVRFLTNWYLILKLSRMDQEPWGRWGREWEIQTVYYTVGLMLRL